MYPRPAAPGLTEEMREEPEEGGGLRGFKCMAEEQLRRVPPST